jgi:outer membrane protein assembly factor BamB
LKWSHDFLYGGAVDSTPAVSETSTVYVGSGHLFFAVDSEGKEIWYFPTFVSSILSSPVIGQDGTVYFGGANGKFYALSGDLRKTLWTFTASGPILSSPAQDQWGNFYFGSEDGYLYSLTPSGNLRWKFKSEGGIESSPVLDSMGNVYFGSKDFSLYSLDPSGNLRFSFRTEGSIISTPAISSDGKVFFGSRDGRLYALSTETGTKLWTFKTEYPIDSSPTVDPSGHLYFGGLDKFFYCLDSQGQQVWRLKFPNGFSRSSAVIDQHGRILVGCDDGSLYCIGSSGEEPETPTSPTSTPTPTTPPFSILLTPPQVDLYPGSTKIVVVNIHPLDTALVSGNLEVFATPGLSVFLSPSEFQLSGQDLQAVLNISVPPGFPSGTYSLELRAIADSFEAKVNLLVLVKTPVFPDVPSDYWAFPAVGLLTERGVVNGYPDGTFKPENPVSRAEFSKMILLSFNLEPVQTSGQTFPDVPPGHWAHKFVEAAVAYGLVQGYPDGTFRPEGKVTLAEAITLIVRAKRWTLEAPVSVFLKEGNLLQPLQPTDWFFLYAGAAFANGLLKVDDPNLTEKVSGGCAVSFNQPASRAQIAVLLSRVLP